MKNLIAVEEGVITIIDTETNECVAILRRNGTIQWLLVKGEPSWSDYQTLLNINTKHE